MLVFAEWLPKKECKRHLLIEEILEEVNEKQQKGGGRKCKPIVAEQYKLAEQCRAI